MPRAALTQLPASPAVFALYGAEERDEPYIGRTPNLRGRLERLLQPSSKHPRRLQLAGRVRRIAWRLTGSDFESLLTQFSLLEEVFGARVLERMHLRSPAFVRFLGGNPYPRITVTNRPSQREAEWSLWAVCFASGGGALCRGGAEAVSAAPLHGRSESRSEPSGLRVFGDEDVPCALLQGVHG